MLKKEDFTVIKALKQHGVYNKGIAALLGVHPKTVSRALKRGSALSLSHPISKPQNSLKIRHEFGHHPKLVLFLK